MRCYLVDASIYLFRAWFALPDTITDAEGEPANAVYGFTDFMHQFLDYTRALHLAFTFDESLTSSFRNEIYPDYKANRESAPEELKRQFRQARAFVRALGIAELASDRWEADDLIGTLAERMRARGMHITVVSGDKDLTQVVREGDEWWEFARNKRLSARNIEQEFGVPPEGIPDLLAITGDKIDNIPGVPGVGVKTAARLLKKFGNVENLMGHVQEVGEMKFRGAQRVQRLLEEHADAVLIARRLTDVKIDADIDPQIDLTRGEPDPAALEAMFEQLGFGEPRRRRWAELLERIAA
jgi:DNA polymerase-1